MQTLLLMTEDVSGAQVLKAGSSTTLAQHSVFLGDDVHMQADLLDKARPSVQHNPNAESLVIGNGLTLSRLVRVLALATSPLRNVRAAFRRSDPSLMLRRSTGHCTVCWELADECLLEIDCDAAVKVATVKLVREAAKVTRGISAAVEGLASILSATGQRSDMVMLTECIRTAASDHHLSVILMYASCRDLRSMM